MASLYEFTIKLNDMVSRVMGKATSNVMNSTSKITQKFSEISKAGQKTTHSIDSLKNRLDRLNEMRNGSNSIRWIRKLNGEIQNTERSIRKLENLPPQSIAQRFRNISEQMGGLIGVGGGIATVLAGFGAAKGLLTLGIEAERSRVQFTSLLGSVGKAKSLLSGLNKYADITPYSNQAIIQNAELLLNFGISHEKIIPSIKALGDVAGGNQEKLGGLSLAYGQIMAKGRLMGGELIQLQERGFNPFAVISKKTGIEVTELYKQMERGAISANMVSRAFEIATEKGGRFYKNAENQSKTFGGQLSTLLGTLQRYAMVVGEKLGQILLPSLEFVSKIVNMAPQFISWIRQSIMPISLLGGAILLMTTHLWAAKVGWLAFNAVMRIGSVIQTIFTAKTWALNAAFWANPIPMVIGIILALIAAAILAYNHFDKFRGVVHGTWEVLKGIGSIIKNYVISRIKELISGISGIGQAMLHMMNGDWKKAFEVGGEAVKQLTGMGAKSDAIESAKNLGKKFNAGYEIGLKANPIKMPTLPGMQKEKGSGLTDDVFADLKGGAKGKADSLGGKDSSSVGSSIESVNGGGSKPTNITINLGKLNEKIEIHTTNLKEGGAEIEKQMQAMLLRVLNSANSMQTS